MSHFGTNYQQAEDDTYNQHQHDLHNDYQDYVDFSIPRSFDQQNDSTAWPPPSWMNDSYVRAATDTSLYNNVWASNGNDNISQYSYSMTSQSVPGSLVQNQTLGFKEPYDPSVGNAPLPMEDIAEEPSLNNLRESMASARIAPPPTRRRHRSQYGPERRLEVTLTRSIGACLICRTLRVKCDTGIPCSKCIKDFESDVLAHGICSRQSLLSTRFNSIDLLRVSKYGSLIDNFQTSSVANYVGISYSDCCGTSIDQDVDFGSFAGFPMSSQKTGCNFKNRNILPLPAGEYLTPGPVLEVFVQQHPVSGHQGLTGPFSRLHKVFGDFAERCNSTPRVALKDSLVSQCLTLNRELNKYHKANDSTLNTSSPVSAIQLKHRSGEIAYQLEMEILYALEKRIYKSGNLQKGNPLSTWICLWLLILSYQEHMHFTEYFNHHDVRVATPLHELSKHMFNGLTTVYATFYREGSPLSEDWNTYEISEELGHDQDLMNAFLRIQAEIKTFYTEKDGLSEHDILFKTLVVDAESKFLALESWNS